MHRTQQIVIQSLLGKMRQMIQEKHHMLLCKTGSDQLRSPKMA